MLQHVQTVRQSLRTLTQVARVVRQERRSHAQTAAAQALQLHRACAEVCRAHRWRIEVQGELPEGAALLVANHQSYIDPLLVCSHVPCIPIAKRELSQWPMIGVATRALGVQFMDRGSSQAGALALRKALGIFQQGVKVLNFPEGTTTRGSLQVFHTGMFGMARRAQVPVVPVAIQFEDLDFAWVGQQTFVPHYLKSVWRGATTMRLHVGPAFLPAHYSSSRQLATVVRTWLLEKLQP